MAKKRSWEETIDRLNETKSGKLKIVMGSPGSAQVTRVRLLREYRNLLATTTGSVLNLAVAA